MQASIKTRLKQLTERAMSDLSHTEFLDQFAALVAAARLEERQRACRIILEFEGDMKCDQVRERKSMLVDMIMDEMKIIR